MDPIAPNPSATTAPAAAPFAAPNTGVPAATTPIPQAVTPVPGAGQPVIDGQAPAAAAVPPGVPAVLPTPPVDWEARARQVEAERNAERAQIAQGIAQLREQQVVAQEQAAYGQRLQMAKSQAQQIGESDPARAVEYMERFYEGERMSAAQAQQQREMARQAQFRQTIEQIAAPQYAEHLARQYNLPADYAELLKQVPGSQMDQVAPAYARAAQERAQLQAMLQQQNLSNQANQMQASGAYTAGGSHAPASPHPTAKPTNRRERDLADWQARRARQAS